MVNLIMQRTLAILAAIGLIGMIALAIMFYLIKGFILIELMRK